MNRFAKKLRNFLHMMFVLGAVGGSSDDVDLLRNSNARRSSRTSNRSCDCVLTFSVLKADVELHCLASAAFSILVLRRVKSLCSVLMRLASGSSSHGSEASRLMDGLARAWHGVAACVACG